MSKPNGGGKPLPPPPPLRTFEVDVLNVSGGYETTTIEAHSYDESPFGALTFILAIPFGEIYVKKVVVHYPHGEVRQFREVTRYEPQLVSLVTH